MVVTELHRGKQQCKIAQLVTSLELLESRVHGSAIVVDYMDASCACTQLLLKLTALRDRFSIRAYVELYERAVSVRDVLRKNSDKEIVTNITTLPALQSRSKSGI